LRACIAPRRSIKSRRRILAPTAAAGKAQAFAAQQPPRGQSGVDQVAFPTPALLAAWTLTLEDVDASTLEEANKPRAVTARALDSEGGQPELLRPGKQAPVARRRRRALPAVELGTERIERDGDVDILMRVDTDCHRPLHDLASYSSRWSTGLDRAVSGKGRTLLSGHRPVERSGGGRQVGFKARKSPPAWLWVIPSPLRTLSRPSDRDGQPATLHSMVERSVLAGRYLSWCQTRTSRDEFVRKS